MPYVKQKRRPDLDPIVDAMTEPDLSSINIKDLLVSLDHPLYNYDNKRLDPILEAIQKAGVLPNGDINYILFKYAKRIITPSYNNYKDYIGIIYDAMSNMYQRIYIDEYREAAEEIRRRILAPYEDQKIIENGDVE